MISNSNAGLRAFVSISDIKTELISLIHKAKIFNFNNAIKSLDAYLTNYLREDLRVFIEYPYIDKFYRDIYYNYYSTKSETYNKDCIRISFFSSDITWDHFRNTDLHDEIKNSCLGFIIIRPLRTNPIGRTFISPKALKKNNFRYCSMNIKSLINGFEFDIKGFPHFCQDGEYNQCAETSICNIMDYFSKYPDHRSIKPSDILKVLKKLSTNDTPSNGLLHEQISLSLKKFGLGVKTYFKPTLPNAQKEFKQNFNDYIESGLPIIAILRFNSTYHSNIFIGHELESQLEHKEEEENEKQNNLSLKDSFDFYENKRYLVIDDNFPPYQLASFEQPCGFYPEKSDFKDATIVGFIVPVDKKVYIDSKSARSIFKLTIEKISFLRERISQGSGNLIYRTLLTSSNAYKKTIVRNKDISSEIKDKIENIHLSRFIWLIEIGTVDNYLKNTCLGFAIIDATGSIDISSVIFILWRNEIILKDEFMGFKPPESINARTNNFPLYINNLKET